MTTFHLTVVTPDGCAFDGQAERIVCRAIDGDLAILAKHGDYCTALGMGEAHIVDAEGRRRRAAYYVLFVLKSRVAQMHVHIYQAGGDQLSFCIYNSVVFSARRSDALYHSVFYGDVALFS